MVEDWRQGQGMPMKRRLGLQAKMTVSYLLVTAAAVILVEVVVLGVVVPGLVSQAERPTLVPLTASGYANRATLLAARLGRLPTDGELQLGDRALRRRRGHPLHHHPRG
jgi:hypothetical protein